MSALLTAKWKKWITPKLVSGICVWFDEQEFHTTLCKILSIESNASNTLFNCLKFRGELLTFRGGYSGVCICEIGTTSAHFNLMYNLIANRDSVKECSRELTAYLQNGLAMCRTLECIEQIFPEFILERINFLTAPGQKLVMKPAINTKHIKFIEQYAHVVGNIKYQIIVNSLVSEPSHAKPNIQ